MGLTRDLSSNDEISARHVVRPLELPSVINSVSSRFSSYLSHLFPETVALARPILFIALALFILCSTSISQPSFRPETGTLIKDFARNGYGELMIHNNWTMDTYQRKMGISCHFSISEIFQL